MVDATDGRVDRQGRVNNMSLYVKFLELKRGATSRYKVLTSV